MNILSDLLIAGLLIYLLFQSGVLCGIAELAFNNRLELVPFHGELYDLPFQIRLGFA
jgi:hypothetical protein